MNKQDFKEGEYVYLENKWENNGTFFVGQIVKISKDYLGCHTYICNEIPSSRTELIKNEYIGLIQIMTNQNLIIHKIEIRDNVRGHGFFYYIGEDLNPYKFMNEAKKQEFKVEKLSVEKKVNILLCKLLNLIDRALENNDQSKFKLYSGRYNKIKNKYSKLLIGR